MENEKEIKLTDEEIEKALEICGVTTNDCTECPYEINKICCVNRIEKDTYNYIQRLKAETKNSKS